MIRILTKKHLAICFAGLLSGACSGQSQQTRAAGTAADGPTGIQDVIDAGPGDEATGVPEAIARELLDRLFREAGLRIVNDVKWSRPGIELTLDGYDPERDVGYEYIAAAEAGAELDESERIALQTHPRIFVAAPAARDQLQSAAEAFLAALASPAGPDAAPTPAP